MNNIPNLREILAQDPAEILAALPRMGRVMLSARGGGATHERIGLVESVVVTGDAARLSGAAHDSTLGLAAITRVVADRTSKMRDKALPRLECQDSAGETLYSLIALDGPDQFEQALAAFGPGEALTPVEKPAFDANAEKPAIPADDLGALTFSAIHAAEATIGIELRRPDLTQSWLGPLPEPKPAMGFVNIMQGDFHLHLKAGAVARWRRQGSGDAVELHGEDTDGKPLGLVLVGSEAAFAGVPAISGKA